MRRSVLLTFAVLVALVGFALAGPAGTRPWTVHIPDLGRAFVRDRAVFEIWRTLLAERH